MKKLVPFKWPFLSPVVAEPEKMNLQLNKVKTSAVATGKERIKRYLACSNQGGVFVQTIEIEPDGETAWIVETSMVRRGEETSGEGAPASPVPEEFKIKKLRYRKTAAYKGGCPYCKNRNTFRCPACGTTSCSESGPYPFDFICPVCDVRSRVAGTHDYTDFAGVVASETKAKALPKANSVSRLLPGRKEKALPKPVSRLLPKRRD